MKNITVYVGGDAGREGRLQAGLDLARTFGGHLSCVQATPPNAYIMTDMFGGAFVIADVIDHIQKQAALVRTKVETQLAHEDVAWDLVHCDATPADAVIGRARLADIIVLTRSQSGKGPNDAMTLVGDVVLHARTPVLAVPETATGYDSTGRIMVLWNGSFEAANAVRAALPLLAKSRGVDILTIAETPSAFPPIAVAEYLSRHGIKAELQAVQSSEAGVAETLISAVFRMSPACVVMGLPQLAGAIGLVAVDRAGGAQEPSSVRPLYVRRPDAEVLRDEKLRRAVVKPKDT